MVVILAQSLKIIIIESFNENNTITLEELRKTKVLENFGDIDSISVITLYKFLNKEERLTLKRSTPKEEKRNDPVTLLKRKKFVLISLQPEGILHNSNCIFIDEAGFNINMIIKAEQEQNI